MCHPTVRKHTDMIETISDQWPTGGSGKPYWSLCISRISLDRVNHKYCILFLLFLDTCNVWGLIIGITIPSFDLITDIATLLVRVISHPRDLVTRCAASGWISPSGHRVSLPHAEEQIPVSIHTPQPIPLEYLSYTFMITLLRCDGWCNLSSLGRWWLNMISRSKE